MRVAWTSNVRLSCQAPLLLFLLVAVAVAEPTLSQVQFKTRDGLTLNAFYIPPQNGKSVVVMLHGLSSVKEEWQPLARELEKKGWGAFAYDAREPGPPWERNIDDVGAALRYLKQEGVDRGRIVLAGASFGANVAINYAALTGGPLRGVLLFSPGLNYQGVTSEEALRKATGLPVLIIASEPDRYAYASSQRLKKAAPSVDLWTDVKPGHGVRMFDENLLLRVLAWIEKRR